MAVVIDYQMLFFGIIIVPISMQVVERGSLSTSGVWRRLKARKFCGRMKVKKDFLMAGQISWKGSGTQKITVYQSDT